MQVERAHLPSSHAISTPIEGLSELRAKSLRAVVPLLACVAVWTAPTYFWAFVAFAALCAVLLILGPPLVRPLFLFAAGALLFGLINISHWRGYIDLATIRLYAAALLALFLPFALLPERCTLVKDRLLLSAVPTALMVLHVAFAFVAVAAIYARLGIVVVEQALRFEIPPMLEYIVRSTLPLAALIPLIIRRTKAQAFFLVLVVVPSLLIGSRGSALIAILSFLIVRSSAMSDSDRATNSRHVRAVLFAAISTVVIFGGFYLRRSGETELAAASFVARTYFDYQGWWVYAIMPFHLGFREPAGLTNQIITEPLVNDINPTPLFYADLFTVLPGEQLAAGQSLGRIVGTVDAGGLTPGLLGGLYLDFGTASLAVIFLLGSALALLAFAATRSILAVPLFVTAEMQMLHLFHRGFLKPEYVTSVLIVVFYLWLADTAGRNDVRGTGTAHFL